MQRLRMPSVSADSAAWALIGAPRGTLGRTRAGRMWMSTLVATCAAEYYERQAGRVGAHTGNVVSVFIV